MLRIDTTQKKLTLLATSPLGDSAHWERDIQAMIIATPDSFCEEIREHLWIIGQEVKPSEAVSDRIDILALDESGSAVVLELKRGTHKLQLFQALSYAGMISRWPPDRFVETLSQNYRQSLDEARSNIEDHTGSDVSSINNSQRILLVAEDFDPALLVATEWLHENYGVDIRCYRLELSQEQEREYLTCTCIYPPLEIATLTRGTNPAGRARSDSWNTWTDALDSVENSAMRDFFMAEIGKGQENRLRYRELIYRIGNKRRFWVACRKEHVHVRQGGRFPGDEAFWRTLVSAPKEVAERDNGRSLRFHLAKPEDFAAFKSALVGALSSKSFTDVADFDDSATDD